ncbi:MAG: hypothetical protein L0Y54_00860 [Sporichthyaceae bacterium]|nr:hypothetical protein [Sporichthyaceae bacterium]
MLIPRCLHYPGNLTGRIEGQVVGPTLLGEHLAIGTTEYDPDTDHTTAHMRYATPAETTARQLASL